MRLAVPAPLLAFVLALALVLGPAGQRPALARYVLDYGDSITVTVKDAPQYSFGGAIRPDGVVTIPYLGELEIRGLTPDQVRERLREVLGKVLRSPEISVVVSNYRPRVVTVLGEVARPGNVDLSRADQSVLDTIALAGGFTDHAIPNQVVVLRGNGPSTRRIPVDVAHMLQTGDLSGNVKLEPGDRVQVPRSPWPTWADVRATLQTVTIVTSGVFLIIRLSTLIGGGQ